MPRVMRVCRTLGLFTSVSSLAVYDAVNAITGQYQPFYYRVAAPANASIGAAAAAAAHRVLVNYFPSQQTSLDSQFATSLAGIADGGDKTEGVTVGEAAAAAVINARRGDGLEANITYTREGTARMPSQPVPERSMRSSGELRKRAAGERRLSAPSLWISRAVTSPRFSRSSSRGCAAVTRWARATATPTILPMAHFFRSFPRPEPMRDFPSST